MVGAALLTLTGCATCRHEADAWEYRIIEGVTKSPNVKPDEWLEAKLNAAAREGWVVVSSSESQAVTSQHPYAVVILKRHKK